MGAKTADNRRLKRLAKEYADACVDFSWEGYSSPEDLNARQRLREARKRLHNAIDSLTILSFGPKAIEGYP